MVVMIGWTDFILFHIILAHPVCSTPSQCKQTLLLPVKMTLQHHKDTNKLSTINCVMSLIEGLILLKQQLRPTADNETHVSEALIWCLYQTRILYNRV